MSVLSRVSFPKKGRIVPTKCNYDQATMNNISNDTSIMEQSFEVFKNNCRKKANKNKVKLLLIKKIFSTVGKIIFL